MISARTNCGRATKHKSGAWLYSWWEAHGEGHELRVIKVRNPRGLLVEIISFMTEFWSVFVSRSLIAGTESSKYNDVIERTVGERTRVQGASS